MSLLDVVGRIDGVIDAIATGVSVQLLPFQNVYMNSPQIFWLMDSFTPSKLMTYWLAAPSGLRAAIRYHVLGSSVTSLENPSSLIPMLLDTDPAGAAAEARTVLLSSNRSNVHGPSNLPAAITPSAIHRKGTRNLEPILEFEPLAEIVVPVDRIDDPMRILPGTIDPSSYSIPSSVAELDVGGLYDTVLPTANADVLLAHGIELLEFGPMGSADVLAMFVVAPIVSPYMTIAIASPTVTGTGDEKSIASGELEAPTTAVDAVPFAWNNVPDGAFPDTVSSLPLIVPVVAFVGLKKRTVFRLPVLRI